MLSLSDLPTEILEKVVRNLNQFQAIKLAPLHSKFQYVVKQKLYSHIFVYGHPEDEDLLCYLLGQPEVFKIRETINNIVTNKWTLVHEYTIMCYLSQMNADQPILYLEMNALSKAQLESIVKHFRKIKYFTPAREQWSKDPELGCIVPGSENTFYNAYNLNREWAKNIYENSHKYHYIHKAEIDMADLQYFNQLPNLKQLRIRIKPHHKQIKLLPCTLKLNTLKLYFEGSELEIQKYFDTSHIRKIYIDSPLDLRNVFGIGSLDEVYPLLDVLVISNHYDSYHSNDGMFNTFKMLNFLSHQTLSELTVNSFGYSHEVVHDACSLTLRFPNTNINWWELDFFVYESDRIQIAISPRVNPSCIGFYWNTIRENLGLEALAPYDEPYGIERTHIIMPGSHKEKVVKLESPIPEMLGYI